jgi:hypothetical protein
LWLLGICARGNVNLFYIILLRGHDPIDFMGKNQPLTETAETANAGA